MISIDDFLLFSDRTLDGFRAALARLDDTTVNVMPPLPGPNSPFQLVIHTVSAVEWWSSHIVLGEPSDRDRPAEFEAKGRVAEAVAAVDTLQQRLHELGPRLAAAVTPLNPPQTQTPLEGEWTVGACMIHAYEEMAQHLGHLEITVDLVAASD